GVVASRPASRPPPRAARRPAWVGNNNIFFSLALRTSTTVDKRAPGGAALAFLISSSLSTGAGLQARSAGPLARGARGRSPLNRRPKSPTLNARTHPPTRLPAAAPPASRR